MTPVENKQYGKYPIEIASPSDFISKFMPFIRTSMKAIQLINGISGFVNCLGYPTPHLSSDTISKAKSLIEGLDKPTTANDFFSLQNKALYLYSSKAKGDVNTLRGSALRDFERFLKLKDKENTFSGLSRVHTKEGVACWTMNTELINLPKISFDERWLDGVSSNQSNSLLISWNSQTLGQLDNKNHVTNQTFGNDKVNNQNLIQSSNSHNDNGKNRNSNRCNIS
jgi:hypothetical protein